jgi:cellulose synthase/poly-beta-1,6-N-acetylglucosamine synthase-like glycosyltransferase
VIVFALALFLAAKAETRSPTSNDALFLYGITVTTIVLMQMAVAFTRYRDPARSAIATLMLERPDWSERGPLVTCLVAVHNDELIIEDCVRSLLDQTYPNKEIIVVDDASTDGTLPVLRRLEAEHGITVIALDQNVGKKAALAEALLAADGSIFAFTDSDSVWEPEALERATAVFVVDEGVGAVSGHCRALNGDHGLITKIQDSWYEGQFSVRKAFESAFGAVTCVSGPFAAFRRAAIFNFIPEWKEDRFLGQQFRFATDRTLTGFVLGARQQGSRLIDRHTGSPFVEHRFPLRTWKVVYAKSVRARTEVPNNLPKLVKQQVRWKKSFLRNMFFTGRFYWRRPLPTAIAYYLHVAFVLLGPFVAFRHLVYAPLHGNLESGILYVFGILLIGSMFSLAYWREEPDSRRWAYRPLMSLLSTLMLSWLLFYALLTIKRMSWARG